MKRTKFLIIGSGPTGLGAAYNLKKKGEDDFLILERSSFVGGLATSFTDPQGFTWDVGGHVQFSHYDYFDRVMAEAIPEDQWLHHQRESWVWMRDRFIPYPFQNNIRYLPKDAMWDCLKGLVELTGAHPNSSRPPRHFKEWILESFGEGVANHFMIPYNYKVWAYPPEQMSYQWIGERVATINLNRILENIVFEKMDASWGPNNTFQFPLKGGTGGIWNSVAQLVGSEKIHRARKVIAVDPFKKAVRCENGQEYLYENLLSTMPLDILSQMVKGFSPLLQQRARQLKHSTSNIIGIGVKGRPVDSLATKCWMYFPEDTCPFYRMTMFSNYSPLNVPDISQHYSLMCEVSESPVKEVNRGELIEDSINGLRKEGLLPEDHEVISRWSYTAPYGYPTPSLDRDRILSDVIPSLDSVEVFSRGRFGGWKYEVSNQDHSFMQGVEWSEKILKGSAEQTFRVDTTRDPNLGFRRKQPAQYPAATGTSLLKSGTSE